MSAIVFPYRGILEQDLGCLEDMERAKKLERLSVVLSLAEMGAVLVRLDGQAWWMANLLYSSGLCRREYIRLRIKDAE